MNTSRFYLCAIPAPVWVQPATAHGYKADIAHFVADALSCERRIRKEVNLENEYERYSLCCQRLEQEIVMSGRAKLIASMDEFGAVLQAGRFPALTLDVSYLALLAQMVDQPAWERFGATFFPPDQISEHLAAFSLWVAQQGQLATPAVQLRQAFLEAVQKANCGVVELQTSFHAPTGGDKATSLEDVPAKSEAESGQFIEIPSFPTSGIDIEFFGRKGRKQRLAGILRNQILAALETGEPVTFGNQAPHDVITEILNEFVFVPAGETVRQLDIRIAYADGSEANAFPLFCLSRIETSQQPDSLISPLRVALMSMRHLELDPEIDFCWFRNREVSRTRTLAETDQFCFAATIDQLRDSLALGNFLIHIYHTGFEPAVLGFYRGLVQTLMALKTKPNSPALSVVPFYYRGEHGYQAGTIWC
jgi:hypothetical protein